MNPVVVRTNPAGRSPFHVSWGALFAGAAAALGVWVLLYALGLALGLSTVDPSDTDTLRRTGVFTGLWGLLTPLVALFIGGLVAGRSAGPLRRGSGAIHGLIVWSLTALGGLVLVVNMFGGALGSAVSVGKNVASRAIVEEAVGSPEGTPAATPQEGVVGEVNQAIGRVQANAAENIKQGAVEAASETGTAFWVVFGALLLGMLAAMAGGAAGVSREQRSLAVAEVIAGTDVATAGATDGRTTLTGVAPVAAANEGEVAELRSEIAQLRVELRDLMQNPPHVHH